MVTADEWRDLALAMPEAEEKSHFEQPDFRARNKIFAGLSPDGRMGTLKLSPDAQSVVVEGKPDVFHPAAGAWGRSGWTRVTLAEADRAELKMLIAEAWALVAPKKLVESHRGVASKVSAPKKVTKKSPSREK